MRAAVILGINSALIASLLPTGAVVKSAYAETTDSTTYTTSIALDDTLPQNTEGTEVLTCSITPTAASSTLRVTVSVPIASANYVIAALFRDSGADAIAVGTLSANADSPDLITYVCDVAAGSTSATTFKVRCGSPTGADWRLNGKTSGPDERVFGGASRATISIQEIKA